MPQELYPSSYVCDCGYECSFCEGTVREIRQKSLKKPQALIADDEAHEIIFSRGKCVAIWCPRSEEEHAINH